ncbi:hypothetical protein RhiirA4_542898 [Rhizophagus irregularis]|uniref:SAM domain-containing protein n=1 Tax=Rhizophagus irregularis TaxID=588596 RepID=A0A2I1GGT3_9GLOM|nr:hypothetical protein RhiirA4_542898 [Rhizophagus irregularis]
MEEIYTFAVVPKAKQQIFFLVKRRRVRKNKPCVAFSNSNSLCDVTNDLVINNGSIQNIEEIKDGMKEVVDDIKLYSRRIAFPRTWKDHNENTMFLDNTILSEPNKHIKALCLPQQLNLVENWDTESLIDFLKEQNLKLEKKHFDILRKEEITGLSFLDLSEEKFRSVGFALGPATLLAKEVQTLKEKPKRAFSSYLSLKEVLAKYNLVSEGIIPLFIPQTYEIKEDNKHFVLCMTDINLRLQSYGTLVMTSLESMRNEYVSTILHTALRIAEDTTNKKFSMKPEYEITGDESADGSIMQSSLIYVTEDKVQQKLTEGFAQNIKQLESSYETNKRKRKRGDDYFDYLYGIVTSARDWHFLLYSPGEILQASKAPFSIEFTEESLVENSEEYQTL